METAFMDSKSKTRVICMPLLIPVTYLLDLEKKLQQSSDRWTRKSAPISHQSPTAALSRHGVQVRKWITKSNPVQTNRSKYEHQSYWVFFSVCIIRQLLGEVYLDWAHNWAINLSMGNICLIDGYFKW